MIAWLPFYALSPVFLIHATTVDIWNNSNLSNGYETNTCTYFHRQCYYCVCVAKLKLKVTLFKPFYFHSLHCYNVSIFRVAAVCFIFCMQCVLCFFYHYYEKLINKLQETLMHDEKYSQREGNFVKSFPSRLKVVLINSI